MAFGGGTLRGGIGLGMSEAAKVGLKESEVNRKRGNQAALMQSLAAANVPPAVAAAAAASGSHEAIKYALERYGKQENFRPATAEEKAAAGVDQNAPLFLNSQTLEPKFGPPSTNVTLNADKSGAEALATETIKSYKSAQEGGLAAQKRIGTLDTMSKAAEGFQPGALAQVRTDAKRYLRDLGFKVGDDVPDAQVFEQLATQLQIHAAPQGQGSVSNYERTLYAKAVPNMTQDPAALRSGIEIAKRLDQYDMQVARIYRDSAAKDKNGLPNYLEVQNKIGELGPPLTARDYAVIKQYGEGKATPASAAPAPAIGTPTKLKPGTYNWTPGGMVPAP
jgi:hypothetical protein